MSAPTVPKPHIGKPARPDLVERRQKVLTMRNAGATFAKIAEALAVSEQTAKNDCVKAIREMCRIPAEQMVDRQEAIFRDILRAEYPAVLDPQNPRHDAAVGRVLEVLRDEARLFGLNKPVRVNLGISEEEFGRQAAELLRVVGTGPLRELARAAPVDAVVVEEAEEEEPWSNL